MRKPLLGKRKSIEAEDKAASKCPFTSAFLAPHLPSLLRLFINVYWFRLALRQSATENLCQSLSGNPSQKFRQKIMHFLPIFTVSQCRRKLRAVFLGKKKNGQRLKGKNWGSLSGITRDLPQLSLKVNSHSPRRGVATPLQSLPKGECTPIMRNFLR